jgi:hypothetical protein
MTNYIVYKRDRNNEPVHLLPSLEVDLIEVAATISNCSIDINDVRVCKANSSAHTMATLASTELYSLNWDEDIEEFWRVEAKPLYREFSNLMWIHYAAALEMLEEPLENIKNIVRSSRNFDDLYVDLEGYVDGALEAYQENNESTFFDILTKKFDFKQF